MSDFDKGLLVGQTSCAIAVLLIEIMRLLFFK